MEKHIIKRDGLPPIAFTGEKIAEASSKTNRNFRWTDVTIYKTKGGRYVAEVRNISCVYGERDGHVATSCSTPAELIDWLRKDCGGDGLGRVSQEAVEAAGKTDPAFASAWVEDVE